MILFFLNKLYKLSEYISDLSTTSNIEQIPLIDRKKPIKQIYRFYERKKFDTFKF